MTRLKTVKTVGIGVQYNADASMFSGLEDMDFSDGAEKLQGLLITFAQPAR